MGETRERAKQLLVEVNKTWGLEFKASEVNGATSDELTALAKFYKSYVQVAPTIQQVLTGTVESACFDDGLQAIEAHRDVIVAHPQIRTVASVNESAQRMERAHKLMSTCTAFRAARGEWQHIAPFVDGDVDTAMPLSVAVVNRLMESNSTVMVSATRLANTHTELANGMLAMAASLDQPMPMSDKSSIRCDELKLRRDATVQAIADVQRGIQKCEVTEDAVAQDAADRCTQATEVVAVLDLWITCTTEVESLSRFAERETIAKCLRPFQHDQQRAIALLRDTNASIVVGDSACKSLGQSATRDNAEHLRAASAHVSAVHRGIRAILSDVRDRCSLFMRYPDEQLLEIVGGTDAHDAASYMPFVRDVFSGWSGIIEDAETGLFVGVRGGNGDELMFTSPIECSGSFTTWLPFVVDAVREALQAEIQVANRAVTDIAMGTGPVDVSFLSSMSTQGGTVALHLLWTTLIESLIAARNVEPDAMNESPGLAKIAARPGSAARQRQPSTLARLAPFGQLATDRPGSAKARGRETKVAKPNRPASASVGAASVRGRSTPSLGADRELHLAPRRCNIRDRHMSATSVSKLQKSLNQVTAQLQRQLAKSESSSGRRKVEVFLALHSALQREWETSLKKLKSLSDYAWQRQPRAYYCAADSKLVIECSGVTVDYGYEFHGDVSMFVPTSAVLEAWEGIATAMTAGRGALLVAGPACGKSATLRAFAQLCGRTLWVPHSSDHVLHVVRAAAEAGAWCALTNVDAWNARQQSALARLGGAILAQRGGSLSLDGCTTVVSEQFAVFATVREITAAHSDLQPVFLACHLAVADVAALLQSALCGCGFREVATLAWRLASLSDLLRVQLTARGAAHLTVNALTALVRHAGELRRHMSSATEEHVFLFAVEEFLLPRLDDADRAILLALLAPMHDKCRVNTDLSAMLADTERLLAAQKVRATPEMARLVNMLHRTAVSGTPHAPLIVWGPRGTGKSLVIETAAQLAQEVHDRPLVHIEHVGGADVAKFVSLIEQSTRWTASQPLWVLVREPTAAMCAAAHKYAGTANVVVVFEVLVLASLDPVHVACSTVLTTNPLDGRAAIRAVCNRYVAAVPHVWTADVAAGVQHLMQRHLAAIEAATSTMQSAVTILTRIAGFITQTLQRVTGRSAEVVERAFWLCARWACDDAEVVAAASQTTLDVFDVPLHDAFLQSDGSLASWCDLTAQQFSADDSNLLFTEAVARAHYLASLALDASGAVALVGEVGLAKSLTARRVAADRGYSVIEIIGHDVAAAVAAVGATERPVLLWDDASPSAADARILADAVSGAKAKLIITARKLPAHVSDFVPHFTMAAVASAAFVVRLAREAKLDHAVGHQLATTITDLETRVAMCVSVPQCVAAVRCLAVCDRTLLASELSSLLVSLWRGGVSSEQLSLFERVVYEAGGGDSADNAVQFTVNRSTSKRATRLDRAAAVELVVENGLAAELACPTTLRCIEATALALHVGVPVALVGAPGSQQDDVVAVTLRLLDVSKHEILAPCADFIEKFSALAQCGGAIRIMRAAALSSAQWACVADVLRGLSTRPRSSRELLITLEGIPDLALLSECDTAALSANVLVVNSALKAADERCEALARAVDADITLTQMLCNLFARFGDDTLRRTLAWHSQQCTEVFAECHKAIFCRQRQLRFCNQVLLDVQQKATVSQVESAYDPDGTELGLRAFEGTVNFANYPEGKVRLLLKLIEASGKIADVQHASVWYQGPASDVVQVPATTGGQCRSKADNGKVVLQTATVDFTLEVIGLGSDGVQLSGVVSDTQPSALCSGTCFLTEVVDDSALCRKWLRYGLDWRSVETEATVPATLLSPEQLGMTAEESERFFTGVQNVTKKAVSALDEALRSAVHDERKATATMLAMAASPLLVDLDLAARRAACGAMSSFLERVGITAVDPMSRSVLARVLGTSQPAFEEWIASQHDAGLPHGDHAMHNAVFLEATARGRLPSATNVCVVVDPWAAMSAWFRGRLRGGWTVLDAASHTSLPDCGNVGVLLDCQESELEAIVSRAAEWKLLILTTATCSAWCSAFPTLDAACTVEVLRSQYAWQQASIASDATQQKLRRAALAAASTATVDAAARLAAIGDVVNDAMNAEAAEMHRHRAYAAFGEQHLSDAIAGHAKAQLTLAETASSFVFPPSLVKELEELDPVATRLGLLVRTASDSLKAICSAYAVPHPALTDHANAVLRTHPKSPEAASRAFLERFICTALPKHRTQAATGVAVQCCAHKIGASRNLIADALRAFRLVDVEAQRAFEADERKDQEQARVEADQRQRLAQQDGQQKSKGRADGKTVAPKAQLVVPSVSPRCRPDMAILDEDTWLRVLAVHSQFECFKTLPEMFHDDPTARTRDSNREAKWREWSSAALPGQPPGFEKDASVHALARASLLLALRPERVDVAARMLISDAFGADFAEAVQAVDPCQHLAALDAETPTTMPIVLYMDDCSPEAIVQLVANAVPRKVEHEGVKRKGQTQVEVASADVVHRSGIQSKAALLDAVREAADARAWLIVTDADACDESTVHALLHAATTAFVDGGRMLMGVDVCRADGRVAKLFSRTMCPRVGVDTGRTSRTTLKHHVATISDDLLTLLPSAEWGQAAFAVAFVAALVERRYRLFTASMVAGRPPRQGDADLRAAWTLLVRLVRPERDDVPWDELRKAVWRVLSAGLGDSDAKEVAAAYVDWILHPDVLREARTVSSPPTFGQVQFPAEATLRTFTASADALSDEPASFGLHSSAQARIVALMLRDLQGVLEHPLVLGEAGQMSYHATISAIPKWPVDLVLAVHDRAASKRNPLDLALIKEINAYCTLRTTVIRALLGPIVDSNAQHAVNCSKAPLAWQAGHAHGSLKAWLRSVNKRFDMLVCWATDGTPPQPLALAGCSDPRGVVAAFTAACSNELDGPCGIATRFTLHTGAVAAPGALCVCGVGIEAAAIDADGLLCESAPDRALAVHALPIPVEHPDVASGSDDDDDGISVSGLLARRNVFLSRTRPMSAVRPPTAARVPLRPSAHRPKADETHVIALPLFRGEARDQSALIGHVEVLSRQEPNHWVLRGAALHLAL